MVMFAFEFAVLFITSSSITLRYVLALYEIAEVQKQTQAKVQERREEIRMARQEAEQQTGEGTERPPAVLEREEDVDENDIDVPGWEAKGKWILFLDLFTGIARRLMRLGTRADMLNRLHEACDLHVLLRDAHPLPWHTHTHHS